MGDVEAITIGPGSEVTMNFTLTMKGNGIVADGTEAGEPMTFHMGDGSLIHGLEMVMLGLKVGDTQIVELDPLNAFGYSDLESIHAMPRSEFSDDLPLDIGTIIAFSTPSGDETPGMIKEVRDDEVIVDFNHPLAGHDVIFEVEILAIKPGKLEQDSRG